MEAKRSLFIFNYQSIVSLWMTKIFPDKEVVSSQSRNSKETGNALTAIKR